MNIAFLIGNGFDLNLGMNTRYSDFYEYYRNIYTGIPLVESLKESLTADIDNWADFELQFGQYCKHFETVEDFEVVFDDVVFHLAEYIEIEQDRYIYETSNKSRLYKALACPEKFLTMADKETLKLFKSKWANSSYWKINIISYNYSMSIDNLLGDINPADKTPVSGADRPIMMNKIKHIHGLTTEDMVVGVNDVSQVNNEILLSNSDFLTAIIKPECNKAIKHLVDKECKQKIRNANLICLFGLSIGDTDKIWWEIIGERLLNENVRLIIFSKGDEIPALQSYKTRKKEEAIKNIFLSKTKLTKEQKDNVKEKIFVGYNTDIFNIKLEEKNQ